MGLGGYSASFVAGSAGAFTDPYTPGSGTFAIVGNLTVSGTSVFSGTGTFIDDVAALFGTDGDASITYNVTDQTVDTLVVGLPAASNHVVFCQEADKAFDYSHGQAATPSVFVHSAAQNTGQWISLTHTGSVGLLATGAGSLQLAPVGNVVAINDNVRLRFGTSGDSQISYNPSQTPTSLYLGVSTESRGLIIAELTDEAVDLGHAQQVDPTIWLHSSDATDTSQYGALVHDQTDFVLTSGKGNIKLATNLARTVTAAITASVTQTQVGGTALTTDFNFVSTVANANDAVTMQTAVAGMEVTVANDGANILQIFPASGDDLGAGVDLSRTLDPNERIEFIARDATTWDVEASTEITHAEYTQGQNTNAFVMSVASQFHLYHSDTLAAGDVANWTFDGGGDGAVPAIASIVDGGGGEIDVTTSAAHNLAVGDVVSITNTGDAAYDIVHVVTSIGSATVFGVVAAFTATGTGSVNHGASLTCGVGQAGTYKVDIGASATSATNNETFDFCVFINAVAQTKTEIRRKFGTAADFGSFAKPALLTIADGDVVTWAIQNNDTAGNITVRNVTMVLDRK